MKNKLLLSFLALTLSATIFTACGSTANTPPSDASVDETAETEEKAEPKEEKASGDDAKPEAAEDESTITPPVIKDEEEYKDVIAGLSKGQWYAFVTTQGDHDAMLVTNGTFDNQDGTMAAIDAKVYYLDKDGNPVECGEVVSSSTSFPIKFTERYIYAGGNHEVTKTAIDPENVKLVVSEQCVEEFNKNGKATYQYTKDGEEIKVDNDGRLRGLFDEAEKALVVNFIEVE